MVGFLAFLVVAAVLGSAVAGLAWLASRARRRGLVGSALRAAMAAHDEALHGTAHDAHVEIQAAASRKAPILSPDGPWGRGHRLSMTSTPSGRRPRVRPRRRFRLRRRSA